MNSNAFYVSLLSQVQILRDVMTSSKDKKRKHDEGRLLSARYSNFFVKLLVIKLKYFLPF